jgi:hypothetical protein
MDPPLSDAALQRPVHPIVMGLWNLVCYLTTPRVILSHAICVALLWHLVRQGTGLKVILPLALVEELVTLGLWWAIPNSWATILTLAASIYVYETLLGPRIFVKKNAVLVSGEFRILYALLTQSSHMQSK